MNDDNIFRSGLNRNLKISIIAPTTAWYDQVQPMLQSTKQIDPDQVLVLDGSTAEPRKRVQEALRFGSDALIAWEPLASEIAAVYPQLRVFPVQPSILDLLNSIRQAPKDAKLGVIIPFSLRDYYADLIVQFNSRAISFYGIAPDQDEKVLQHIVCQAAGEGVQALVGTEAIENAAAGQNLTWIPLHPGWGGLVRAFFQALWSVHRHPQGKARPAASASGVTAHYRLHHIIGSSPVMTTVKQLARTYAVTDSTVLITGESGTGKEMLAQAIHNLSHRQDKPFVAINCGSITESLLESELFGYTGGTFTGARRDGKKGLFEAANGGTLFLDEVGDMPYTLQNRLLRVLQEKYIRRIGGHSGIPVDVRILAATNKDLEQAVKDGHFRLDLYYRLAVLPIRIPPLRERREDIADISRSLLYHFDKHYERHHSFQDAVLDYFRDLPWPGNVRQLSNVIERLVLIVTNEEISLADVQPLLPPSLTAGNVKPRDLNIRDMTYDLIEKLGDDGKSVAEIAKELGISRSTVYRLKQKRKQD